MLFKNATIATMTNQGSYGLIECGALYIRDGKIDWVGKVSEIPSEFLHSKSEDLDGRLVTPGLIDCHTHIVYGGNRSVEFEMRLNGASYEDVARAGGGIISTVSDTRLSSIEDLVKDSLPRVDQLISEGVTLIEVKSGYGLDRETELKMLKAARQIQSERPIRVVTTFLGAHAVPPEYKDDPDTYIDTICIPTLHDANNEGLVDSVDAFCENIAFDVDQAVSYTHLRAHET